MTARWMESTASLTITFDSQGRKSEHVTFAPQNTLERIQMSPPTCLI